MKLTIIGASGHGRVVADIAKLCGYDEIEFLDDNENLIQCGKYPVVGKTDKAFGIQNDVFIGIGNTLIRRQFQEKLKEKTIVTLKHPDAVITDDVTIGIGTVIMAGAVINSGATIGNGVIINTCSSVDHDCIVEDFVHIAVGAHLCGAVTVGESTWIGAGSTIINNVKICGNTMIGAGAVVIKDISEKGTYVGIPAQKHKG